MKRSFNPGFTIVELLIVIVVIAILAAITIVAYNGIQERAQYSSTQVKMSNALKAIQMYYSENGQYPDSENCATGYHYHEWCGFNQGTDDNFIPGLVPQYVSSLPNLDSSLPDRNSNGGGDTLLYRSKNSSGGSGTSEFNLIRYRNVNGKGLSSLEKTSNPLLMGGEYSSDTEEFGWGYRSTPSMNWF